MKRKMFLGIMLVILIVFNLGLSPIRIEATNPPTTSLTVTKHDAHGQVISTRSFTLSELKSMPVVGDGTTHYYHEEYVSNASTQDEFWDVNETGVSVDMGTPQGTDIKDLCNLVGGAARGSIITVKASDGYCTSFPYENVYYPQPRQGKVIIAWSNTSFGGDVPNFTDGLRLEFMAETINASGQHIYSLWDMHETLPSAYHGYNGGGPSTLHISIKWVSNIDIYEPNLITCDVSGNAKYNFTPGETVYVKGAGLSANTNYKLWIQPDPVLQYTLGSWDRRTGTPSTFLAVDDPSGSQELITTDSAGDFSAVAAWNVSSSASNGTKWDISADNQASGTIGTFDTSDEIDNPGDSGFTVASSLPAAAFATDIVSGGYPLKVHFTDQSAGTYPINYAWDFDNNGTTDSIDPNPIHTFTSTGNYSVKLTITTSDGNDQELKENYINVVEPQLPAAAFSTNKTSGPYPLTVLFTDQSSGPPTNWVWDFGDGSASCNQNPQHKYEAQGTYTVTLTAANFLGSDAEVKTDYITVTDTAGTNPEYPWADWPLTVTGLSTVRLSQPEFETLAADPSCDSEVWVDDHNNSYKGISLWRLIAMVDGGDESTLNEDLAGVYSLKLTGQNPDDSTYIVTIDPPYTGFDFYSSTQDIIIANKEKMAGTEEWTNLSFDYITDTGKTKLRYPLVVGGSGVAVPANRVAALTNIELINLPTGTAPTISSFSPSSGRISTPVVITGINLSGTTALKFGGNDASSFSVISDTRIIALVGNGSSGTISLTTAAGIAHSSSLFTYIPIWDLNGDHVCNIGDVVKIGLVWGQNGTAGWIDEDANRDGAINIGDVVFIGLHWGETW